MIKLRDYNNSEMGTRFPVSEVECPRCGKYALEDNWPPNYYTVSMGETGSIDNSIVKYVCPLCKIAFRVTKSIKIEIEPLIKTDGVWLTPHDMWTESYKKEHGEYPNESYS